MNHRTGVLIGGLGLLVVLSGTLIYQQIRFSESHFRIGSIPPDILKKLERVDTPTSAMRPPAVRAQDQVRYGNATSVVSIIEFGDVECPYCRTMHPIIQSIASQYKGRVRYIWRDYPIEQIHPHAMEAAIALRCAGLQGKYWEAFDEVMQSPELDADIIDDLAKRVGINQNEFRQCQKNPAIEALIRQDIDDADALGVKTVPLIFVGTTVFDGQTDEETLKKAVDGAVSGL